MQKFHRIHIFVFLLVGLVGFNVAQGRTLPSINNPSTWRIQQDAQVTTDIYPLLNPSSATCDFYWEPISTSNGLPAFITLNVNNPANSTNSAEWRPDIPSNGLYKVEAFIPAPPIVVSCSKLNKATQNTTQAVYKIHHTTGISEVTINQSTNINTWVNLGTFQFGAGAAGFVALSDLNSESSLTRFVSFSAIRFSSQPKDYANFLPIISNSIMPVQEGSVVIRQRQAFDSCIRPSLTGMQAWWNSSPYYIYNIYMGGISNSSCFPDTLTATWISAVHAQGWEFIPTWVGPQAPCTSFKYRFSENPQNAFGEGIQEANLAYNRASSLGLVGPDNPKSVIYYDMEAFYGGSDACRLAVQNFLSGWSQRLHELNIRSGVYGSSCYYMPDWKSLSNPLDDTWLASWYTVDHDNNPDTPKKYFYDPYANVWSVACSGSLTDAWRNHQRIRQYAGGHNETWGGVTVNIDSNITDGHVFSPQKSIAPDLTPGLADVELSATSNQVIGDFQLVAPSTGWVFQNGSLFLTEDNGSSWIERTPESATMEVIAFHFQNPKTGWILARNYEEKQSLLILHTVDGGLTWIPGVIPVSSEVAGQVEMAYFDFIDNNTGWFSIRLRSSSAFSSGLLFFTRDAGETWQDLPIPIGEPVNFITNQVGWTAGGAAGDEFYKSLDGGVSWESAVFLNDEPGNVVYNLPEFSDPINGTLLVTINEVDHSRIEQYRTQDGGTTWQFISAIQMDLSGQPGIAIPAVVVEADKILVVDTQTNLLYKSDNASLDPMKPASGELPDGIVEIQFISSVEGWAKTVQSSCSGEKSSVSNTGFSCSFHEDLWKTSDGGLNWELVR